MQLPGRTAKECRRKYFSAFPTPPQQQPRVTRRALSSPARASTVTALFSDDDTPEGKKKKKRGSRKRTARVSRKSTEKIRKESHSDGSSDENASESAAPSCRKAATGNRIALAEMDANDQALGSGQARQGSPPLEESLKKSFLQSDSGSPEVLRRSMDQKKLGRYLKVLHKQKRQDTVRANDRLKRQGTAGKQAAGTVVESAKSSHSTSTLDCDTVPVAEEVLRKCFDLTRQPADGIDHTFDEQSDGELDGESDRDPDAEDSA